VFGARWRVGRAQHKYVCVWTFGRGFSVVWNIWLEMGLEDGSASVDLDDEVDSDGCDASARVLGRAWQVGVFF